jgi:hypothetical protein
VRAIKTITITTTTPILQWKSMGATPADLRIVTVPAQRPSLQRPVSHIKIPVFALTVYRHYPNTPILFCKVKIRNKGRL